MTDDATETPDEGGRSDDGDAEPPGGDTLHGFAGDAPDDGAPEQASPAAVWSDDEPLSDAEVTRALEIADARLDEAEQVLWAAAGRAESDATAEELEALTHYLWNAQNRITDLEAELSASTDGGNGFDWGP